MGMRPAEVVQRARDARWGSTPGDWSSGDRWARNREREREAHAIELPATPAHVAFACDRRHWAFPPWLQYVNDKVTEFLLRPGFAFLMFEISQRMGKSTHLSKWTPIWYEGLFPDRHWLQINYGIDLARKWGGEARDIYTEHGPRLFGSRVGPGYSLQQDWRIWTPTDRGHRDERGLWVPDGAGGWELSGGMRSISRGGQVTGHDAHVVSLDDPIKDEKEADSKRARDALWAFYTRRIRGRLEPNGKVMLTMSRQNVDDIAGRLQDRMVDDPDADQWDVIHLKAIAEPTKAELEEAKDTLDDEEFALWLDNWRDSIGRPAGEPLWKERYSKKDLLQIKANVGPRAWAANFQNEPTEAGGDKFPKGAWVMMPAIEVPRPAQLELVRRWDLASSTSDTADYTASGLVGMDKDNRTFIFDVWHDRLTADKKRDHARNTAMADDSRYPGLVMQRMEQEPGSAGKDVADDWVRATFAGFRVEAKTSSGSKELRAEPLSGQVLGGNVYIVMVQRPDGSWRAPNWFADFADEADEFPNGAHDDMIDAVSAAYLDLVKAWDKRRGRKVKTTSVAGRTIG